MFVIILLKHPHSLSLLIQVENKNLHTQRQNSRSGTKAAGVFERQVQNNTIPVRPERTQIYPVH